MWKLLLWKRKKAEDGKRKRRKRIYPWLEVQEQEIFASKRMKIEKMEKITTGEFFYVAFHVKSPDFGQTELIDYYPVGELKKIGDLNNYPEDERKKVEDYYNYLEEKKIQDFYNYLEEKLVDSEYSKDFFDEYLESQENSFQNTDSEVLKDWVENNDGWGEQTLEDHVFDNDDHVLGNENHVFKLDDIVFENDDHVFEKGNHMFRNRIEDSFQTADDHVFADDDHVSVESINVISEDSSFQTANDTLTNDKDSVSNEKDSTNGTDYSYNCGRQEDYMEKYIELTFGGSVRPKSRHPDFIELSQDFKDYVDKHSKAQDEEEQQNIFKRKKAMHDELYKLEDSSIEEEPEQQNPLKRSKSVDNDLYKLQDVHFESSVEVEESDDDSEGENSEESDDDFGGLNPQEILNLIEMLENISSESEGYQGSLSGSMNNYLSSDDEDNFETSSQIGERKATFYIGDSSSEIDTTSSSEDAGLGESEQSSVEIPIVQKSLGDEALEEELMEVYLQAIENRQTDIINMLQREIDDLDEGIAKQKEITRSHREYNERLIAEERVLEYERMQREYRDIMNYKRKYNLDDQEKKFPGIVQNESMGCILNIKMTHRHAEDIKYNFANVENENMGCFLNMKMTHRHAESDSECSEIHPSEKGKPLKDKKAAGPFEKFLNATWEKIVRAKNFIVKIFRVKDEEESAEMMQMRNSLMGKITIY